MRIGAIGDDFTGSSDIANTLARAGARTLQYVGVPEAPAPDDVDAAVISLKTRSVAPVEAVAQSLAACRWLLANGAKQIVFKYCSTFDSTPEGNIGPVAEALLIELDAPFALVCPAFPANGRTVYLGHLFVQDRLLSESGMQQHPLTPMTDPDIRRWLQRQTALLVGHIALAEVRGGPDAALERQRDAGARLIVADALDESDLLALGRVCRDSRLVTGGSGIAMGLPANFGIMPRSDARFDGVKGPGVILSGSCSAATRRQVERYQARHPHLRVTADDLLEPDEALRRATCFLREHRGDAPLIFSTAEPGAVEADQKRFGRERLASLYDGFFGALTAAVMAGGFRRVVSAGGETSGAVASALAGTGFRIGPEIAAGVPALTTLGAPELAVTLKSGNFGDVDFFERALSVLEGRA